MQRAGSHVRLELRLDIARLASGSTDCLHEAERHPQHVDDHHPEQNGEQEGQRSVDALARISCGADAARSAQVPAASFAARSLAPARKPMPGSG